MADKGSTMTSDSYTKLNKQVMEVVPDIPNSSLIQLFHELTEQSLEYFEQLKPIFPNIPQLPDSTALAQLEYNVAQIVKQKKWTQQECLQLDFACLAKCLQLCCSPIMLKICHWDAISKLIEGRHWKVCRSKWLEQRSISIVEQPWTQEEDNILLELQARRTSRSRPNKWSEIAMEICRRSNSSIVRLGKQCRERWINKLDPMVNKGPWYKEEELKLFNLLMVHKKRWSMIAHKYFHKLRTENAIKNRFHSIMKKQAAKHLKLQELSEIYRYKIQPGQSLRDYNERLMMMSVISDLQEEIKLSQAHFIRSSQSIKPANVLKVQDMNGIHQSGQLVMIKKKKFVVKTYKWINNILEFD